MTGNNDKELVPADRLPESLSDATTVNLELGYARAPRNTSTPLACLFGDAGFSGANRTDENMGLAHLNGLLDTLREEETREEDLPI